MEKFFATLLSFGALVLFIAIRTDQSITSPVFIIGILLVLPYAIWLFWKAYDWLRNTPT